MFLHQPCGFETIIKQSFSTSALILWAKYFYAVGDCSVHCRMFHCISDLCPSPSYDNQKKKNVCRYSQINSGCIQVENHCSVEPLHKSSQYHTTSILLGIFLNPGSTSHTQSPLFLCHTIFNPWWSLGKGIKIN